MKTPECFREAAATLRRRLYECRLSEHRLLRAFGVLFVALGLIAIVSSVSGANGYRNTNVASPVKPVAKPISSYKSGLIETPNPVDSSKNLMITGNVAGGQHFRGAVPYSAPSSIKAPLGSRSLDSFMRYTTSPKASDRISGRYSPYYSPSGTASALKPGQKSIPVPGRFSATTDLGRGQTDAITDTSRLGIWSQSRSPIDPGPVLGDATLEASRRLRTWPLPEAPEDTGERRTVGELTERGDLRGPRDGVTEADYQRQVQDLQDRLGQVVAEMAELERNLQTRDSQQPDLLEPSEDTIVPAQDRSLPSDTAEARREALLEETARLLAATRQTTQHGPGTPAGDNPAPASDTGATPRLRLYEPPAGASETPATESVARDVRIDSLFLPVAKTTRPDTPSKFDQPLGPIASYWAGPDEPTLAKASPKPAVVKPAPTAPAPKPVQLPTAFQKSFDNYLKAGQAYLKQGQYHKAADAFALAAAYKPDDPCVHLGKSHALFAAGEYASSAFFLGKAVELDAKSALAKSDLIAIAGGPDPFIVRFNELAQQVQAEGVPQIQFLLAYVYHQMDRPEEARSAVDAAQAKLPSSVSIDLLRKAISPR